MLAEIVATLLEASGPGRHKPLAPRLRSWPQVRFEAAGFANSSPRAQKLIAGHSTLHVESYTSQVIENNQSRCSPLDTRRASPESSFSIFFLARHPVSRTPLKYAA
jgi:hypothetical protein